MRRIAILGGGMAGLTAAWRLSGPECRDELEVTVYQRGWRLGGKGASSRGEHGRIEEHGLHVWMGYYDNAFGLIREVYEEVDRARTDPACPLATWRDAFAPSDRVGLADRTDHGWSQWMATFSRNDDEPGDGRDPGPLTMTTLMRRGLDLLVDFADSLVPAGGGPFADVTRRAELAAMAGAVQSLRMLPGAGGDRAAALVLDFLTELRHDVGTYVGDDDAVRRASHLADIVLACLTGMVSGGLLADGSGFAAIDHLDFREWLARNGATPESLETPLIRGMYDLVFAYENGDPARPRFSAGLGLFLSGKMFFQYKGSIFWSMRAGMGDVVFAPMYQALRARGVRFEFFHRLDDLHLSADGRRIEAVTLGRQAQLAPGITEYEPLTRVKDLPCFPAEARHDQLDGPAPADLESHWASVAGETPVRLRAGEDFDEVVLATSLGMIPSVAGELLRHSERWRRMTESVATVATQALQLWVRPSEAELGWAHHGATVSAYVHPFDTYASMSHLLERESWPASDAPATLGYFCSVLPDRDALDPVESQDTVWRNASRFMTDHIGHYWPNFRRTLLCGRQYWRANVDHSDRYVQSLPGTGAHRLRADESGYDNLFLAGDWINSGLNAGCIEAAAMAGIQAANCVRRRPLTDGVVGFFEPRKGGWA